MIFLTFCQRQWHFQSYCHISEKRDLVVSSFLHFKNNSTMRIALKKVLCLKSKITTQTNDIANSYTYTLYVYTSEYTVVWYTAVAICHVGSLCYFIDVIVLLEHHWNGYTPVENQVGVRCVYPGAITCFYSQNGIKLLSFLEVLSLWHTKPISTLLARMIKTYLQRLNWKLI